MDAAKSDNRALFSRNFIAVASINFFIMTAYYLLFVISTPYAVKHFQASPSMAGLVAGAMVLGILVGRFVTGGVIGRVGFARVLYFGLLVHCISALLYLAADTLPLLLLNRFVGGVGVGCVGTMTGTIVAHIIPAESFGLGISYFSMSTVLALAVGPFLGISLQQSADYTPIFLLCLGLGLVSFCIAPSLRAVMRSSPSGGGGNEEGGSRGFRLKDYIEYSALPISLVLMVAALCYSSIQGFISFYADEIRQVAAASFFFLVYALVSLLTRPISGRMFDARGENSIMYLCPVFLGCSLLLLSTTGSTWGMLLSGALLGLGYGNMLSTGQALVVRRAPRHRFGQTTSTFFIMLDLGMGFGPYCCGLLVPLVGYSGMYKIIAAVAFLTLPMYYFLHGKKALRPPA